MVHERKRYIEPVLQKALKASSIVGILGHRQAMSATIPRIERVCSGKKDTGSVSSFRLPSVYESEIHQRITYGANSFIGTIAALFG